MLSLDIGVSLATLKAKVLEKLLAKKGAEDFRPGHGRGAVL
jgi:hypothetical protein